MKFTGICLVTPNVLALAKFYQRVLGVPFEGNETHVTLRTEGAEIAIFSTQGMEEMAPQSMQGAGWGGVTLGFEVADVDAEYERLQAQGVTFVKLPASYPWGTRSVWFRDPDGNVVNFFMQLGHRSNQPEN